MLKHWVNMKIFEQKIENNTFRKNSCWPIEVLHELKIVLENFWYYFRCSGIWKISLFVSRNGGASNTILLRLTSTLHKTRWKKNIIYEASHGDSAIIQNDSAPTRIIMLTILAACLLSQRKWNFHFSTLLPSGNLCPRKQSALQGCFLQRYLPSLM